MWGGPYDLILMPNFLHHFDAAGCVALLRCARGALAPGGLVLAPEFGAEEDCSGPPLAVMCAFIMLATPPAGTTYTGASWPASSPRPASPVGWSSRRLGRRRKRCWWAGREAAALVKTAS